MTIDYVYMVSFSSGVFRCCKVRTKDKREQIPQLMKSIRAFDKKNMHCLQFALIYHFMLSR